MAILVALSVIRYERFASKRHFGDFHVYHVTGERLLERSEIYIEQEEKITPFKYSPLVASWFALLALLPENWAAGIWHVLNLAMLFACFYIGWLLISEKRAVLITFICVSPPTLHCLNSGQVGFAITLFYYLGIYFAICDRPFFSAFFFVASAMFKFLPLMVIPYFLFQRNFRFLIWSMAMFIFFHLAPALWLGWDQNLHYLKSFIPHITATTLDHVSLLDFKNQSIWAYLYRLIYYDFGISQIAAHPKYLTWMGAGLLGVIYTLIVFRKNRTGKLGILIDLSVIGILIVIFNPNAWKHNFVLLILPCMLVAAHWLAKPKLNFNAVTLLLVMIAFVLTNRSVFGWALRHDAMSLSILPITSLVLILALLRMEPTHHSLLQGK